MSVHSVLSGIDPHLVWPGMLVTILMVLGAVVTRYLPPIFSSTWVNPIARLAVIALGALAGLQLVVAGTYFLYPSYLDWVEPMVAAASWLGWRGAHLYPSLYAGDAMGDWYGPLLFQLNGLLLWLFGPSIQSSKILGEIAFFATQFLSFWTLKRNGASQPEALTITFVQCLLQAVFANQAISFGVRSDPILVLAAQFAILVAISGPSVVNATLLGLLMGLSANLKVHAGLYIVPIFFFFIAQAESTARRAQLTALAALAAIASLVLPFTPANVSIIRYLALFGLSPSHGFSRWIFEENIIFLMMCWSPIVWLYALAVPKLPRGFSWFLATCIPCMTLVAVEGAVNGAGPYHLLPFVPSLAWVLVLVLQGVRSEARNGALRRKFQASIVGIMVAFLVGLTPVLAMVWGNVLHKFSDAPRIREALVEIDQSMRRDSNLSVEVGPGPYHDLRVVPVFRGNLLPIDSVTWWDLKAGGVDEQLIRKSIESCRVDRWLLQAGGPIFSEAIQPGLYSTWFLREFRDHYEKVASGRIFDEWRCIRKD